MSLRTHLCSASIPNLHILACSEGILTKYERYSYIDAGRCFKKKKKIKDGWMDRWTDRQTKQQHLRLWTPGLRDWQ